MSVFETPIPYGTYPATEQARYAEEARQEAEQERMLEAHGMGDHRFCEGGECQVER